MMETYAERLESEEFKKKLEKVVRPTITAPKEKSISGNKLEDIVEHHPIMEPQIPGPNADRNVENVIKDLRWRAERGLQKYGVTTERKDLSVIEWLQHLQEELMDATVYIEKLKSQIKEEY